jgi:hypothetical protein
VRSVSVSAAACKQAGRYFLLLSLLVAACATTRGARLAEPKPPTAEAYLADVTYLTSPRLQGRGLATEGIEKAARFIQREFAAAGLQPIMEGGFEQRFTATVAATQGPNTRLRIGDTDIDPRQLRLFGFSSSASFSAPVVFAGYGITAPEFDYDDYAEIDVKGKVVLILRYEPRATDPDSVFNGNQWSEHATFRSKIFNARRQGAAGVIVVTGPLAPGENGDALVPVQSDPMAGLGFGIPMFHVARSAVEPILEAEGIDLHALQTAIDEDLQPRSRLLALRAEGNAELTRIPFPVANIVGLVPGRDPSRTIVIGAHYDHLGFGGPYRPTGPTERIHFGADDNASGTAGLLALARYYASGAPPPVNMVFAAFSAEESGLVGSTYFVQHPPYDLSQTVLMVNLDMIGRLRNQALTVFGVGSAVQLDALLDAATPEGIRLRKRAAGYGPSDHAPFYASGIPVLHFFTGSHAEYHSPSDTVDRLNIHGSLAVLDMVRAVVDSVGRAGRLTYVPPEEGLSVYVGRSGARGEGFLGIVPTFAEPVAGVRVARVEPASPAYGILAPGDIVVSVAGEQVLNFYELHHVLRSRRPGDRVPVAWLREGSRHVRIIELGQLGELGKLNRR